MKVIDALQLIEIDVNQYNRNSLGNSLRAELYWVNQRIDFNKEAVELTDDEYKIIANVYIPKTLKKRIKHSDIMIQQMK